MLMRKKSSSRTKMAGFKTTPARYEELLSIAKCKNKKLSTVIDELVDAGLHYVHENEELLELKREKR